MRGARTVLVVHGKLALQLLSDAGHVCFCCVLGKVLFGVVTGCDVVKTDIYIGWWGSWAAGIWGRRYGLAADVRRGMSQFQAS